MFYTDLLMDQKLLFTLNGLKKEHKQKVEIN